MHAIAVVLYFVKPIVARRYFVRSTGGDGPITDFRAYVSTDGIAKESEAHPAGAQRCARECTKVSREACCNAAKLSLNGWLFTAAVLQTCYKPCLRSAIDWSGWVSLP